MLLQFSDEYCLVLRLVVIMLLVPCDTSECERVFSLMNDLKTAERSRINQDNLKHVMLWFQAAKGLEWKDVPVLEILKEFRRLAGIGGRSAHRGTAPPKHNYSVKVEEGPPAPAPAPTAVEA